jgi:HrpA-like RNA helicase
MHDMLAPATLPEIQRTPLESLCLQIKLLNLGSPRRVLSEVRCSVMT